MTDPVFRRLAAFWPFLILGTLGLVFALMLTFSRKAPAIVSLEPAMAAPGQTVVLMGDYFGRTGREGSLNIAGEIPPPSLIRSWSDQKIVFTVPEDAVSGLVTVSNSQGTSSGILFTNTETIPTVLEAAAPAGRPQVLALMPGQPSAGQTVVLTGRGFGLGDERVLIHLETDTGAVLEVPPDDSLTWTDRLVSFRWPGGARSGIRLTVVTPRGSSAPFSVEASGPVSFADPRTMTVEVKVRFTVSDSAVTVLAPVPETTAWSLVSSDPAPVLLPGGLAFRWPGGTSGNLQATYRLTLTSFARKWNGWPAGAVLAGQDLPAADDRPSAWWKSAIPSLKSLTASWGLTTPDPWLRLQRLQTGLASSFHLTVSSRTSGLSGVATAVLSSGRLDSTEAASLAVLLAAQSGIPARLVSGLWWGPDDQVTPRTWAEVWITGAGWIPWDVVDGTPGTLDNRHFAFQDGPVAQARLVPRSRPFGPAAPGAIGPFSGEISGSGELPVLHWELTRISK